MSEDPMQHGRDAGTGARTQQHPRPSYLGGPAGGTPGPSSTGSFPAGPAPTGPSSTGSFPTAHPPYPDRAFPPPGFGAPPPPRSPAWGETLVGQPPPAAKRRSGMPAVVVAAVIAGLIGGGGGFAGAYALLDGGRPASNTPALTTVPATGTAATTPGTVAAAAQIATPSTVDIQVRLAQGAAEGSGVILTADGNVLTNNHVVAGATGTMVVTLADGSEHPATLVGTSPSYDLAVIKLQDVSNLVPATLGNSSDLQVGQQVVAIGSPQGLSGTVTTGIVSAFNRTVQVQGDDGSAVVYSGLQTDAPINQGNSGGPLVNLQGQVVGINSAIATAGDSSGSIGLGFAIPVDAAKRVAEEILSNGTATKPVLGVRGDTTGAPTGTSGAALAQVDPGSPAATAGLAAGNVVTKVDNVPVQDFADLIARIGAHAPGDTVTLTIADGTGPREVQVTLGSVADRAATTSSGGQSENPFGGGSGGSGGSGGGQGGGGSGQGGGSGNPPFGQDPFGNPFGN